MQTIEVFTSSMTREEFTTEVMGLVNDNALPWVDAIIQVCETNGIELEDVAKLVDAKVRMELESEFRQMNYLPKIGQLPL